MRMPFILGAVAAFALAGSASAGTLDEITTKGMVMSVGDFELDFVFTPDGNFTSMGGALTGTWRVDGDKLCTKGDSDPSETCLAYPADKKSGDVFEMPHPALGSIKIKIK